MKEKIKKIMKNKQTWIISGSVVGGLLVGLIIMSFSDNVSSFNHSMPNLHGSYINENHTSTEIGEEERHGNGMNRTGGEHNNLSTNDSVTSVEDSTLTSSIEYGSGLAIKDADFSLEDMLTYAIQDEYLAHKEYEEIIAEYGSVNPFANIINAETHHIEELKALFEKYGIAIPEDKSSTYVEVPTSLNAAYQAGVNAEILNIKMYDLFLNEALDDDVRTTFEELMKASQNHLRAFERKV